MTIKIPEELDRLLKALPDRFHQEIANTAMYGLRLRVKRVGTMPMNVGLVGKVLGKKPAQPTLAQEDSKYGGMPYLEDRNHWPRNGDYPFIGQINFDQMPTDGMDIPQSGLLVVFAGPEEPFYHCLWYPEASSERGVRAAGKSAAKWECAIEGERAISICTDLFWEDEWRQFAMQNDLSDAMEEPILAWNLRSGSNACGWLETPIPGPGPRQWCGIEQAPTGTGRWLRLWTPADENTSESGVSYGSMYNSIMVRPRALKAGALSDLAVLSWQ